MATVATLRDIVSALVDSAADERELSGIRADVGSFLEQLCGSGELRDVLLSTVFSMEEKKAVVEDFLAAAGLHLRLRKDLFCSFWRWGRSRRFSAQRKLCLQDLTKR